MPSLHPVLWTKGTLLTPQHLQAQDRYHDDLLRAQLGALTFCPWGLTRLDLDREALTGGTLVVRAVSGRMPDGLLFDAPGADPTPPPRALDVAWAQDQRALLVSLAVPEYRAGARNIAGRESFAAGASTARWRAEEQLARDETTGLAERPIQVARSNLRLLLEGDATEGYTTMPIARLLRAPGGEVSLDPTFVPPLLELTASDALMAMARRVLERVMAKATALAGSRRQRNQGLADFSITDVASFWLLYTLNTHLPALRPLTEVRGGHPEPLWDALTALAGNALALRAVAGRLPDGLLYDAPVSDPLPPPRPLDEAWSADQRAMIVSLAVPEYRAGARNVAGRDLLSAGGGGVARWRAEEHAMRVETTGLAERPIQLARPNLRLLLEGESAEGFVTVPVARVRRGAAGELALDPAFVPPVLDLTASETLHGIARRLVERVAGRAAALAGTRRQRNQGLADFSITDVASFWLLYTLNTHLPPLRHLVEVRGGHPAPLWEELVALAGALTTFAEPRPLPTYDHRRLGECFGALEARLLELLDTAVPETAVSIPLRPVTASMHAVAIEQQTWLAAPQWYLAVSAPMRQHELLPRVLQGFKVGSADVVDTLIRQALPGLELAHVAQPPAGVPVKLDYLYFALRRGGPAWEAIERARNLAVYVPAELPQPRLELVIVLR